VKINLPELQLKSGLGHSLRQLDPHGHGDGNTLTENAFSVVVHVWVVRK